MESVPASLDFELSDRAFANIRRLIKQRAGIDMGPSKRTLVHGRLASRLRALGMDSFDTYVSLLDDESADESRRFLNALTTNVTEFFREPHHFALMAKTIIPTLLEAHKRDRRIRIWSAGCSTGEEPYSVAMVLNECIPDIAQWNVKILATDIDSDVLSKASGGVYEEGKSLDIPAERRQRFLLRGKGAQAGFVKMRDEVRRLITFKQLNLMGEWPLRGPFDIILCRNVIIYFDNADRVRVVGRYHRLLGNPGYLLLGHSESMVANTSPFKPVGTTAYQKEEGKNDSATP